uniref:Uncharacterized protein n=1 Tax=Moniliophthora roreri TaxID=221103 RepID=A0A0W0EUD4_MONRR
MQELTYISIVWCFNMNQREFQASSV